MKAIKKLRSKLLELLTHKMALPLVTKFRSTPPFPYSMEQLLEFPDHTLGKDLAIYLRKMNFRLLRNYERHDCKHIILQFEMDEVGEARMQFYFFGNRHYSFPVISTVIMVSLLMPEHWKKFYHEFKRGRKAPNFDDVDFGQLVMKNTGELRKRFTLCETI
jgi:ubiquinone biosynthesis protein Coq4